MKTIDLTVTSYIGGKQLASALLSDGTRVIVAIKNDGNHLPFELIQTAIAATARDVGTGDNWAFGRRFAEIVEQGGEPRPVTVNVL